MYPRVTPLVALAGAAAQDDPPAGGALQGSWSLAEAPDGVAPAKRDHHTMVFNANTNALLVFGGRTAEDMAAAGVNLNDLWSYGLLDQRWSTIAPVGRSPQTRYLHMAAMMHGSLVVFGGEHINRAGASQADHKLNDLWAFSPANRAWTQLAKDNCDAFEPMSNHLTGGQLNTYMFLILGVSALAAGALVLGNHYAGPGGGDRPLDYFRPRLRAPGAAVDPPPRGSSVVVEMAELAVGAAGAATRKKGYERIN